MTVSTQTENKEFREKLMETKKAGPIAKREIYEMIMQGYTLQEITPIISGNYDVDPETRRRWVRQVLERIIEVQKDNEREYGSNLTLAVNRLLHLETKAMESGDFAVALRCLQEINRIQGLGKNTQTQSKSKKTENKDVSGEEKKENVDLSELSTSELKEILKEGGYEKRTNLEEDRYTKEGNH